MRWIKREPRTEWHRWFAWHPVVVKNFADGSKTVVWLERVYRIASFVSDDGIIWEYGEVPRGK